MLYERTTGKKPFGGASSGVVIDGILNRAPAPTVSTHTVPAGLDRIISKCLEKDRNLRYQTAAQVRDDLERLTRDADVPRVWPRRGRLTPLLVAGLVAVLLAAAA